MQEEIIIKKNKTVTVAHFFNSDINENNYTISTIPAVLKLNSQKNIPLELNVFDGVVLSGISNTVLWKRNQLMNFEIDTYLPNYNYISGRTFTETFNYPINKINTDKIKSKFIDSMNAKFFSSTTTDVFFEEILMDDLYVNVKLERTFDVLDTLNIYNKVSGLYPIRESSTGVVFGKLEAIQKLLDENGNKIRIPLRNVPVGIFISSTDYESPSDTDADGNRIRLNFRPYTTSAYTIDYASEYFNSESAIFDNQFLINAPLDGAKIHPTFSNVVYTNENGEFVLNNVEVGPQILFFEVDLLKQGLTKDEVGLNFFPYPPSYDNVSIDTIPHYFYRAIPIDVVPSWGQSFQTGYTEVNVSANLDLRKWATYIFPPASYKGLSIDNPDYLSISRNPLSVKIRDMSKFNLEKTNSEVYSSEQIQMVEIQDIFEKNMNQQWDWYEEFSQLKSKATFRTYGYHAIKLPANIYDKDGIKTDSYGNKLSGIVSKGVWLSAYQLKLYLTSESKLYRTTGLKLLHVGPPSWNWYDRDHFHCCLNDEIESYKSVGGTGYQKNGEGVGRFPYEKAWSSTYPEPYSIPKFPSKPIVYPPFAQNSNSVIIAQQPYKESAFFSDGDVIWGKSWFDKNCGGLGLSFNPDDDSYTPQFTDFATNITNSDMYKYDTLDSNNQYYGCYAGGYYNGLENNPLFSGFVFSQVVGGEKYQRLEAGYGYFLFPSSLPKISLYAGSFQGINFGQLKYVSSSQVNVLQLNENLGGWWGNNVLNHVQSFSHFYNGKSIAIDFGEKIKANGGVPIINDRLNIYRIVDGKQRLPIDTLQTKIKTYANLGFGGPTEKCWSFKITNLGEITVSIFNSLNAGVNTSAGGFVAKGGQIVLKPGEYFYLSNSQGATGAIQYTAMDFPGNSDYSEVLNLYTKAKYGVYFGVSTSHDLPNSEVNIQWYVDASTTPTRWYVNTETIHADDDCDKNTLGLDRYGITLNNLHSTSGEDGPYVKNVYISGVRKFDKTLGDVCS